MRIGIEINGVLRDTVMKFRQIYERFYIEPFIDLPEKPEFEYRIIEPIDSLNLQKHFMFPTEEDFYRFMYEEHPMELFGHSPSTEMSSMYDLNDFYYDMRDIHDILLVSDEIGKSKPASLFFLSKFGCLVEKIKFYSESTRNSMWDELDILLTANPDLLLKKPDNKIIIKFETEYNKNIPCQHTINKFKELKNKLEEII